MVRTGVAATESSLDSELFRGYELAPGSYDEVFSAPGVLRPAWKVFLKSAAGLSRAEYVRRWEQAQRLLRQNSLAYPDLGDPVASRRPWELDGLPLDHRCGRVAHGRSRPASNARHCSTLCCVTFSAHSA